MTIYKSLFSLVIPILAGLGLILGYIWIYKFRKVALIAIFLSIGYGIGFSSILYFAWSIIYHPNEKNYFYFEAVLVISLVVTSFLILRQRPREIVGDNVIVKSSWITLVTGLIFTIALLVAIKIFYSISINNPNGFYDAYAIWNLRARFIYRSGVSWLATFPNTIGNEHYDYPLLIPGAVSRGWDFVNDETHLIPIILAGLFTFGTVGLLFSSISSLRSYSQAFIASLILVSTPAFISWGASQEADIPLGFYILSTYILLYLHSLYGQNNKIFVSLSGMAVGFALWTKNDGWSLLIAVFISGLILLVYNPERKSVIRDGLYFLAGLTPILFIDLYFKIRIAPPNDLFTGQNTTILLQKMLDYTRYETILKAFSTHLISFGDWKISALLALLLYSLLLKGAIRHEARRGVVALVLITIFVLVQYSFVYLITPYSLEWHIQASIDRLLLQLWPGTLFVIFLILRTPEQTFLKTNDLQRLRL